MDCIAGLLAEGWLIRGAYCGTWNIRISIMFVMMGLALVFVHRENNDQRGQVYPPSHSNRQAPDLLTLGELEPALPPLSAPALLPQLQVKARALSSLTCVSLGPRARVCRHSPS